MSDVRSIEASPAVESAIARVLAAERDARKAVAQAERESAATIEAARAAARAVDARTERRLRRIRAAFAVRAASLVAELDAQALGSGGPTRLSGEDVAAVEHAAAAVAAALTEPRS